MKLGILKTDEVRPEWVPEFGEYPDMFMSLLKQADPELEFAAGWADGRDADAADRLHADLAAGALFDALLIDRSWNGEFKAASGRAADAWTLEVALPWVSLGASVPKTGSSIRFLAARNRNMASGG